MIKAVIVDFDDTLCLTEEACFALENHVLGLMGRPPMSREIHKSTWGQLTYEAIKTRSPGVDADRFQDLMDETMPDWVAHKKLDVIDEINLGALDALVEQGKQLYVLTSRPRRELHHILESDHELASRIKAFYYRDVMEFHKPDPRAFDVLLKDTGFERNECVYVGDSPSDAAAAKQAHMHFVCSLESGVRTEADFDGLQTDIFISRFADLPAAVALLDKRLGGLA